MRARMRSGGWVCFMARYVASLALLCALGGAAEAASIGGIITDDAGRPLEGAHVRWQNHGNDALAISNAQGEFVLQMDGPPDAMAAYTIGVAKKGYFSLGGGVEDGGSYEIALDRVSDADNPDYAWIPPDPGNPLSPFPDGTGCGSCHADYYATWKTSRHAIAATDPRVLDLYRGTGGEGATPEQGPGYRRDNPDRPGMCANCHAPTAALQAGAEVALDEVGDIHVEGVFCESCHKVREVGETTATPLTGAFGYWRPANGVLMAFGPLDDAFDMHHMGPMSYLPEMAQARFCAGCHDWTNEHGVPVMETFSEWSAGMYASMGMVCQNCHMRPLELSDSPRPVEPADYVDGDPICLVRNPLDMRATPGATCDRMGAVPRNPDTIYPHGFAGADDEHLDAVTATAVSAEQKGSVIDVEVGVRNVGAGHKFPTGMPFRNAILHVTARTADGTDLVLVEGPLVPAWAETWADGSALAGQPGRGFAKIVGDGTDVNVSFWNATEIVEDTRIPPMGKDASFYRFQAPAAGEQVTVTARVVYRRYFPALAAAKGWAQEDIELDLESTTVDVQPSPSPADDTSPNTDVAPGEDTAVAEPPPSPDGKSDACCTIVRRAPSRGVGGGGYTVIGALLALFMVGRRRRLGARTRRPFALLLVLALVALLCLACGDFGDTRPDTTGALQDTAHGLDSDAVGHTDAADTADTNADAVEPGELPESHVEVQPVAPKAAGLACSGDAQCASGRCVGGCDGKYVCVADACATDADCAFADAGATACCVQGTCTPIRGETCGAGDGGEGASCAREGSSACGAGLECIDACEPTAMCAEPCALAVGTCDAPVDPETGRPTQICVATGLAAAHCLDDPEVTRRCTSAADCTAENPDAFCDWSVSRAGDEVVLTCNDAPWGPGLTGEMCSASNQCQSGACWSGGNFHNVCAGLCRPDEGDADCACPAGATGCLDQICVPMPVHLSETDPELVQTVPLCYDATRCTQDCPGGRYCDAMDAWDALVLLCRPVRTTGAGDGQVCGTGGECSSGHCASGACAPRKTLGQACTDDAECRGRCIDELCTQPCTEATYCETASGGTLTSCALVDIAYGPASVGATEPVMMCAP